MYHFISIFNFEVFKMGFKWRSNDSPPQSSPNLHFNLQIKMLKRKLRSATGLLNTLQAYEYSYIEVKLATDDAPLVKEHLTVMLWFKSGDVRGVRTLVDLSRQFERSPKIIFI